MGIIKTILFFVVIWLIGFVLTGNRLWKEDLKKAGVSYRETEKLSDEFLNSLAILVGLRAALWLIYWPLRYPCRLLLSLLEKSTARHQ